MLFNKYAFKQCDINSCILSDRHCKGNRTNDNGKDDDDNNNKMDPMFLFYQSIYDSVHYYLFHLFDLGLR